MQLLLYNFSGKIVAIFLGLLFFKKFNLAYKVILLQVLTALICEAYGYYLGTILHQQNIWLYNYFWIAGEAGLMGLAAGLLLTKRNSRVILGVLLAFSAFVWTRNVISNSVHHYDPLVKASIHISLVITYSILLFDGLLFNRKKLTTHPDFWLCLSVLLYFGCNIPLYGMFGYLEKNAPETLESLFEINMVLNFIRYPLVAVSFYLMGRQHKKPALG